jgi:hypothetical protein
MIVSELMLLSLNKVFAATMVLFPVPSGYRLLQPLKVKTISYQAANAQQASARPPVAVSGSNIYTAWTDDSAITTTTHGVAVHKVIMVEKRLETQWFSAP